MAAESPDHPMAAVGVDLGGSKIEVQLFDRDWAVVDRRRCATPTDYAALVDAIAGQVRWAEARAGTDVSVGIGAAGLVNPATRLASTANLPATGKPLPADIEAALERKVTYINDCRALALSEAVFGSGRGHRTVMALILGTGLGGGIVVDRAIRAGPTGTGGEFGHLSAPAHLVGAHGLPILTCGCGRTACIECYVSGPGLSAIARHVTGEGLDPPEIAARRGGDMAGVWGIWAALAGELVCSLVLAVDPDVVVLGGGLSRIEGVVDDLSAAAQAAQIGDFGIPPIVLAEGGDASGARGAAYAGWLEHGNG